MRNKLSALRFHDKIFIAYGVTFLVMFGVIFGSTNFLIHLAFKREIDSHIETLQAQVSNRYRALIEKVRKEVHAAATDVRLHRVIERQSTYPYLPAPEFDLFEYGTSNGQLLYPDLRSERSTPAYTSLENRDGHIQLRSVPQQSYIGLQLVVQATEVGEWGFVTGGYRLQKWLEGQTSVQSDEHPVFLMKKPRTATATFSSTSKIAAEDWLPLNNASRKSDRDEWFEVFSNSQSRQRVVLQRTAADDKGVFTAFRITPFNSPLATIREAPLVDLIVAYSHERQMEWQQQLIFTLLLSGVAGLALVYLISYIISRRITRPIATLREGVDHIAAGDLDHRVKIRSHNEIGQLAEGFNQMAQELKQSLEEWRAAERAATWRDVARQVAHEIKNPLFPIRLSVENLQQAKSNPEVFEQIFGECTDTVIEEVDRIGKLIDEFHQFARMPKLERKPSQLNNIVRSVLNLYMGRQMPDLDQKPAVTSPDLKHMNPGPQDSPEKFWLENVFKIKVETELAPLPQLSLDPGQIAQALGNLFKNSLEAMPEGGMLKVKTYFTPGSPRAGSNGGFSFSATDENLDASVGGKGHGGEETGVWGVQGIVSLEVQDTGGGISEEAMVNLFMPYYTTKSETNNTGLGMSIVKRIVTEHGAGMDCQSTKNVGTTVRIHFFYDPSAPPEELAAESEELKSTEIREQMIDPLS